MASATRPRLRLPAERPHLSDDLRRLTADSLGAWADLSRAMSNMAAGTMAKLPQPGGSAPLHWESSGDGSAVLLIMGLGLSGGAWWRTVPVLAEGFQVLTFDNRGVGGSPATFHAYSTAVMADDAVSVLDSAGIDRAHVYGLSLGGMVAQQVALRHPDRVRSLVLGATSPGGRHAIPPAAPVLDFLRRRMFMGHEQAARESVAFNYSVACQAQHPDRIEEDLSRRLSSRFSVQAYGAQIWAASAHDAYAHLNRITAPTLVVHGTADQMIPVQNGRLLASRIPNAELRELPGVGHLYPSEVPDLDHEIATFMAACDAVRAT